MSGKFSVTLAKNISFCGGVRWAVEQVFEVQDKKKEPIVILGELIHNRQFNRRLEEKGIRIVNSVEECRNKIAVIRSHGLPPKEEEELRKTAQEVIDLTCPRVKAIQSLARKYSQKGFQVIIAGYPEHPEVRGLVGYTENSLVVKSSEEALRIPLGNLVVMISQTTFSEEKFEKIRNVLKKRKSDIQIQNTLCHATRSRQKEVAEMAKNQDLVIIIGGKHSSNTKKLGETALRTGKAKVISVETAQEMEGISLEGIEKIGVASGASTPFWLIEEVLDLLKKKEEQKK